MVFKEGFWRVLESWQGKEKVRAKPFESVELNLADWWLEVDEKER